MDHVALARRCAGRRVRASAKAPALSRLAMSSVAQAVPRCWSVSETFSAAIFESAGTCKSTAPTASMHWRARVGLNMASWDSLRVRMDGSPEVGLQAERNSKGNFRIQYSLPETYWNLPFHPEYFVASPRSKLPFWSNVGVALGSAVIYSLLSAAGAAASTRRAISAMSSTGSFD